MTLFIFFLLNCQIKSRPYRFGLGKRSDPDMDYDDAALLADQQNWRPWFERGSFFPFFFEIFE